VRDVWKKFDRLGYLVFEFVDEEIVWWLDAPDVELPKGRQLAGGDATGIWNLISCHVTALSKVVARFDSLYPLLSFLIQTSHETSRES
jgi:hypothetical protein